MCMKPFRHDNEGISQGVIRGAHVKKENRMGHANHFLFPKNV